MIPTARDKYGLGLAEISWVPREPERKKRPAKARKWKPRRTAQNPPKPKPVICAQITCPYLRAPVVPGRFVCEGCAEKLERRAAELREREERRTVADTSAPATADTIPGHDQGGTPDA
jgi:hypothetical protein